MLLAALSVLAAEPWNGPSTPLGDLKVSKDGHFIVYANNRPFFYLGDTAWELLHRLDQFETETYLENRRSKGFTVIQAAILAEFDGLNEPNREGHRPLLDNNPEKPNDDYFKHVDWTVALAAKKGLFMGLLPTWGDKVRKDWGVGPVVFTTQNAYEYGRFLGNRYRKMRNIIWILGGDRQAQGQEAVWQQMALGIREGGSEHLITYHPQGGHNSRDYFPQAPWLDFYMIQSGHGAPDIENYKTISETYAKVPAKPILDGEPRYEDHPINWKKENGYFNEFDVRQAAYWSLFSGAFGHTYGCHDVWQFLNTAFHPPISSGRTQWTDAIDLPGSTQMLYLRRLMMSRPYLGRVPDQSLILNQNPDGPQHLVATRGDGFALVYTPYGDAIKLNLQQLGTIDKAAWFDPRSGEYSEIKKVPADAVFNPPGKPERGNDWVLVVDLGGKKKSRLPFGL